MAVFFYARKEMTSVTENMNNVTFFIKFRNIFFGYGKNGKKTEDFSVY